MFLAILQSAGASPEVIPSVVSGGIGALVLYFWRQDRQEREKERQRDAERHAALAADFRLIVQDNTAAMTHLADMIQAKKAA